jgi:hypothetical protein
MVAWSLCKDAFSKGKALGGCDGHHTRNGFEFAEDSIIESDVTLDGFVVLSGLVRGKFER